MNCKIVNSKKKTSVEKIYISNLAEAVNPASLLSDLDSLDLEPGMRLEFSINVNSLPELYMLTDQVQKIFKNTGELFSLKRAYACGENCLAPFSYGVRDYGIDFQRPFFANYFEILDVDVDVNLVNDHIIFTAGYSIATEDLDEGQTKEITGYNRLYFKNMTVKMIEKEGN